MTTATPATTRAPEPTPRRVGFVIITAVFAFLALQAWGEVAQVALRRNRLPLALSLLQLVSGGAAYAAAVGTFRRRPWAWRAALAWGIIAGVLVLSVGPLLDLAPEERRGLVMGSLSVLMVGSGLALYLRNTIKRR